MPKFVIPDHPSTTGSPRNTLRRHGAGVALSALILSFLVSGQTLSAQTIRGRLLDAQTGQPVNAGTVTLLTEDSARVAGAVSDSAGAFVLRADRPGAYRLHAERLGYRASTTPALELEAGDTLQVEYRLSTEAVVLSPIVVVAEPRRVIGRLSEFHERARRRAWGSFVTREDIEKQHPIRTTDLLRSIPGVQLLPVGGGTRHAVVMRGRCAPAVYLDGMRIRLAGMTIDDLIQPQELEGIEVYRSAAEVPGEYSLNAGCGAILLWTRRGG